MNFRLFCILLLSYLSLPVGAQSYKISGVISDSNGIPIELATIQEKGTINGTFSDEKGKYSLSVSAKDSVTLVFSCLGYAKTQRIIPELSGDMTVNVRMRSQDYELDGVTVSGSRVQSNTMERINTDKARLSTDATGGSIESFVITAGLGVSSTNELSTQYSVRGGNYDENMVYVNGIEIYRPLLVRSSQQEGMSFINPDMTESVHFSSGGFDARYGDKMSSALDVKYKKPEEFEGSVSASMLGANAYIGSNTGKFTQVSGFRYKRGSTLLNTLDTKGDYDPTNIDFQTYMTYKLSPKFNLSFLGNYAENIYDFTPSTRSTSYGTMNDVRNFDVYYDGWEQDRFRTLFGAGILNYRISDHSNITLQVSAFQSTEEENYDISGEYWLSNVMDENNKEITGTGSFHEHARNHLRSNVVNAGLSGVVGLQGNTLNWGLSFQREEISDRIREWERHDSTGYSLPYNEDLLSVYSNLFSNNDIQSSRFSGYIQDTYKFRIEQGIFSITAGIRGSYWDFNKEFIFSPRASVGFIPNRNQNLNLRVAGGVYYQSPFYKEFRVSDTDENGNQHITLNKDIKSQRSIHFVLGGDYNFRFEDNRPFKFTTELYYKKMDNLIPYSVNNVRVRYYGKNIADGHAAGIDLKLFGQFVPGTDSWLGFSLMEAKQTINGKKIPMPTDQLYNITLYYTDYFPKNDRFQFNLRAIWADGIMFGIPGNEYTNGLRTPSYRRIDIGMTYHLVKESDYGHEYSFWRHFKNIWLGVDVFNLLDIGNVGSYSWFTDVNGYKNAVPDRLTGRQLNFKLVAEF
ncbi:TonB-dependent receptor [Bacteroidales bacterium OttesenSCG-928-A17]|nr:TonB-dependent receptor [Bacteroidales bacterium OttesenSCG-928-A17]